MKRLSIEEWKKRDNPFKKTKVDKQKMYKGTRKVYKSKIKPIRDSGVVEAARMLGSIVSKKNNNNKESEKITNVNEFRAFLNS